MAQGFLIQQSDRTVPGTTDASSANGAIYGQVFTCGGTGTKTVTELGMFCSRDTNLGYFKLAIFNVDGSNNPTTLVGQTSELQAPSSEGWVSESGLSISVTGGSSYALIYWAKDAQHNIRDYLSTGGTTFVSSSAQHGATYSTWPSSFTHNNVSHQYPIYAVYAIAEVVRIIDPDVGSGYDYDSLYDWEAGEQGNLTTARNEIAVAKCRCTGGTADTTAVTIDGWTTSATQYIKIWTDPAEGYRHDGKYVASGNVYRLAQNLASTGIIAFGAGAQYVRIDGLLIVSTNDSASTYVLVYDLAGGLRLTNCVIHSSAGTKANPVGILVGTGHTGAYSYLVNNIFYNHNISIYCRADGTAGRAYLFNNTVYGSNTGIRCRGDGVTAKNNLVIGCTDCFLESTEFETATDNAYDEGGDPGSDGVDLSGYTDAQIFTDVATFDFSLAASSPAIGVGANLYNDATYPFQDDILGTDRGGSGASWDIGAFEYVSSGALQLAVDFNYYISVLKQQNVDSRILAAIQRNASSHIQNALQRGYDYNIAASLQKYSGYDIYAALQRNAGFNILTDSPVAFDYRIFGQEDIDSGYLIFTTLLRDFDYSVFNSLFIQRFFSYYIQNAVQRDSNYRIIGIKASPFDYRIFGDRSFDSGFNILTSTNREFGYKLFNSAARQFDYSILTGLQRYSNYKILGVAFRDSGYKIFNAPQHPLSYNVLTSTQRNFDYITFAALRLLSDYHVAELNRYLHQFGYHIIATTPGDFLTVVRLHGGAFQFGAVPVSFQQSIPINNFPSNFKSIPANFYYKLS